MDLRNNTFLFPEFSSVSKTLLALKQRTCTFSSQREKNYLSFQREKQHGCSSSVNIGSFPATPSQQAALWNLLKIRGYVGRNPHVVLVHWYHDINVFWLLKKKSWEREHTFVSILGGPDALFLPYLPLFHVAPSGLCWHMLNTNECLSHFSKCTDCNGDTCCSGHKVTGRSI